MFALFLVAHVSQNHYGLCEVIYLRNAEHFDIENEQRHLFLDHKDNGWLELRKKGIEPIQPFIDNPVYSLRELSKSRTVILGSCPLDQQENTTFNIPSLIKC